MTSRVTAIKSRISIRSQSNLDRTACLFEAFPAMLMRRICCLVAFEASGKKKKLTHTQTRLVPACLFTVWLYYADVAKFTFQCSTCGKQWGDRRHLRPEALHRSMHPIATETSWYTNPSCLVLSAREQVSTVFFPEARTGHLKAKFVHHRPCEDPRKSEAICYLGLHITHNASVQ